MSSEMSKYLTVFDYNRALHLFLLLGPDHIGFHRQAYDLGLSLREGLLIFDDFFIV